MKASIAILATLPLLACGQEQAAQQQVPPENAIECAIAGGAFARACAIETSESERGLLVTIRNPRGGFRRLLVPRDGSGAVAADGAEPAHVTVIADGRAEVAIGADRYRLPVALGPQRR
jgi:hypothetical protein